MTKKLKNTSKTLIYISGAISLIFAFIGALLINGSAHYAENYDFVALVGGRVPFLLGVLFGFLLTAVKITLADRSCKKALEMDASSASIYTHAQYFVRYFLTAAVLLTAILIKQLSFLGTALGIISLQLAEYLAALFKRVVHNS